MNKLIRNLIHIIPAFAFGIIVANLDAAEWTGTPGVTTGSGTDWNTATNWDPADVPADGIPADLRMTNANYTINYDSPMAASKFGKLYIGNYTPYTTTLNINAGGFVSSTIGAGANLALGKQGSIVVGPDGDVEIYAGWVSGSQGANSINGGTVLVNGGSFYVNGAHIFYLTSGGSITLDSGSLTIIPGTTSTSLHETRVYGGSTIVINNGEAYIEKLNFGGYNNGDGSLTMTNGTLELLGTTKLGAANSSGIMNISGGEVKNAGQLYVGHDNYHSGNGGTLNLSGGTWKQTEGGLVSLGNIRGTENSLNVTGTGELITTGNTDFGVNGGGGTLMIEGGSYTGTNETGNATITVNRGNINLQNGFLTVDNLIVTNGNIGTITFVGGTMTVKNSTAISNDTVFAIGSGIEQALLVLNGTTNTFADDVQVNSNALMEVKLAATFQSGLEFAQGASLKIDGGSEMREPVSVGGTLTIPSVMTVDLSLSTVQTPDELVLFTYDELSAPDDLNGIVFANPANYKAVDDPVNKRVLATYKPLGTVILVH